MAVVGGREAFSWHGSHVTHIKVHFTSNANPLQSCLVRTKDHVPSQQQHGVLKYYVNAENVTLVKPLPLAVRPRPPATPMSVDKTKLVVRKCKDQHSLCFVSNKRLNM